MNDLLKKTDAELLRDERVVAAYWGLTRPDIDMTFHKPVVGHKQGLHCLYCGQMLLETESYSKIKCEGRSIPGSLADVAFECRQAMITKGWFRKWVNQLDKLPHILERMAKPVEYWVIAAVKVYENESRRSSD